MTEAQAREQALNFALGYLTAVSGWATTANERQSAKDAMATIYGYIDIAAASGMIREQGK